MSSNITIYDDCFISFYDSTGAGDSNITLHFNRKNDKGYHHAVAEFIRMLDSNKNDGEI